MRNLVPSSPLRLIVLALILLFLLAVAIVLLIGMGVGWLLTYIFPFNLFEGSLLALMAIGIVVIFVNALTSTPYNTSRDVYDLDFDEEDEEDDELYDEIPTSRFLKSTEDKTWESWFRYQLANSIYLEFQDSPKPLGQMGKQQLQELSIRVADLAILLCKRKPPHTKKFKITISAIKQEMIKLEQRPYDDDILTLAIQAINEELKYDQNMQQIIINRTWNTKTAIFDEI